MLRRAEKYRMAAELMTWQEDILNGRKENEKESSKVTCAVRIFGLE